MRTATVKTSFSRYADAKLNVDGKHIIDSLTNNADFPNPVPSLAEVSAAWTAFSTSLPWAMTGDRTRIAIKNEYKNNFTAILLRLGAYVNLTANGQIPVLAGSGFPLASTSFTPVIISKPAITVTHGNNPGDLIVNVTNATNATSYQYEYTADPISDASIWISMGNNTRQYTFTRLAAKLYWFRVTAIGSNKQAIVSNIFSAMALPGCFV